MPTYEYRCVSCEHQFERFQRMSDDPVTECEVCGQAVKRLLFPVAIHFKGSGFYSTDYARRTGMGTTSTSGANSSSSEGDSSHSSVEPAAASGTESCSTSSESPGKQSSESASAATASVV